MRRHAHVQPLPMSGAVMSELLEPIRYTLRFLAPHTHYVEVEATLPTSGKPWIELAMAVWTPASYLLRENARHVEGLMAHAPDGAELRLDKSRKSRWRMHPSDRETTGLTCGAYFGKRPVRPNWIENSSPLGNVAPPFLPLVEAAARPDVIHRFPPVPWQFYFPVLPAVPGG